MAACLDCLVSEFVSEVTLPAAVRVVGGVPQDESKSLDLGREVSLLYVEDDLLVRLEDANGRSFHERASLEACRFRLLPSIATHDNRTFATVRHVLGCRPLPEFVRAQSGYSLDELGSEEAIEPGDVFEVGTGSCFRNGVECAIWFRLSGRSATSSADELESEPTRARRARRERSQRREPLPLPLDADGDFNTSVDDNKYYLRELVHMARSKRLRLPVRVCLVAEEGSEGERLPDKLLGRKFTIAELPTRRSVIATDGFSVFRLPQDLCGSLRVKSCKNGALSADVCVRGMASFIDSNRLRTVGPPEPASITSQLLPPSSMPISSPVNAITSPIKMAHTRHLSTSLSNIQSSANHTQHRKITATHTLPRKLPRVPPAEGTNLKQDTAKLSQWKEPSKRRNVYEDVDLPDPGYSYNSLKPAVENGVNYSGDSGVQVAEGFDDMNYAVIPEANRKTFTTNTTPERYVSSSRLTHEAVTLRSRSPGPCTGLSPHPHKTLNENKRSRSSPNLEVYSIPRSTPVDQPEPRTPVPKPRLGRRLSQGSLSTFAVNAGGCTNPSLMSSQLDLHRQLSTTVKELNTCKWELNEAKAEVDRLKEELAKLKANCHCNDKAVPLYTNYEYHVPRSVQPEAVYENSSS